MARYLSAHAVVCSYLVIAVFVLAAPDSGLALGRHVPKSSSARHSRRHRSTSRRHRTRNAKDTSAGHTPKKTAAKPSRTGIRVAATPPSAPSNSSTTTSPASGSLPQELFPAQTPAPKGSTPETPAKPPAPEDPTKTPSPKEQSKSSTPEEPAKTPAPKEPVKTPAPEESTTKEAPSEPSTTKQRNLIWSDEFDGAAGASPGSQWQLDTGGNGWGNEELESYTSRPTNAELDGQGHLVITARAEKYTGKDGITRSYTSARLQTLKTFQFQYGLVEARIQVPAGQGLVAQFWALGNEAYEGSEAWPACGEIDTAEVLGSEPNIVNGTLHAPWAWAPTGVQGQAESATPLSAGFHTYSVEWEPERISFMLDGSVYKTITPADLPAGAAWPFKHPYFLLMDLAVGGEWPGAPDASTHFPAQMLVDWVRVWQ
jgi:beta-glucanase (GH16 family)